MMNELELKTILDNYVENRDSSMEDVDKCYVVLCVGTPDETDEGAFRTAQLLLAPNLPNENINPLEALVARDFAGFGAALIAMHLSNTMQEPMLQAQLGVYAMTSDDKAAKKLREQLFENLPSLRTIN